MKGRIVVINYMPDFVFPLRRNEVLDLRQLENGCLKKGVKVVRGKSCLIVEIDNIHFTVFKKGQVGLCNLKSLQDIKKVDNNLLNFFWHNFANSCIVKEVNFVGKKV